MHVLTTALTAAALAAFALRGFLECFLVGVAAILWCVAAAIRLANAEDSCIRTRRATSLAAAIIVVAYVAAAARWHNRRLEARFARVIAAVEKYHGDRGAYPKELQELASKYVASIPDCGGPMPVVFSTFQDGGRQGFRITCYTFAFNKHTYDSEKGSWHDWD